MARLRLGYHDSNQDSGSPFVRRTRKRTLLKNTGTRFALVAVALAAFLLGGFAFYSSLLDISDPVDASEKVETRSDSNEDRRVIGVISRFNPTITYRGYQPLVDYLSRKTALAFDLRLGHDYRDTVDLVAAGQVEAAFLGSYVYCRSGRARGLRPILRPLGSQGEATFRSVLVARNDLGGDKENPLQGRRLAVPSEDSFSGNWLLQSEMNDLNASVATFSEVRHFAYHHSVVFQVLRGRYELGVVKDRVANEFLNRGLAILSSSPPIPGSPLVVGPETDPVVERALSEALLALGSGSQPEDLSRWDPELRYGFARATESDYEEFCSWVQGDVEESG